MQADFWHQRWRVGKINFHQSEVNALLVAHLSSLALAAGARIFLPLCGKTGDIGWLLAQSYKVAGVELSQLAVDALFTDLALTPEITAAGELLHYQAPGVDIFVGDMFELSAETLGAVDAVYDRAALVAMPAEVRAAYAGHLAGISGRAPQLLISYEYDQTLGDGPPFSVTEGDIAGLYAEQYRVRCLGRSVVDGGLRGKIPAEEAVWMLDGE